MIAHEACGAENWEKARACGKVRGGKYLRQAASNKAKYHFGTSGKEDENKVRGIDWCDQLRKMEEPGQCSEAADSVVGEEAEKVTEIQILANLD